MLKYDVVQVGEFRYEIRDKQTGEKLNFMQKLQEDLEAGKIKK